MMPILPRTVSFRDGRAGTLRNVVEDDAEELCRFLPETHAESDFLGWMAGEWSLTFEQERNFIREYRLAPRHALVCVSFDGAIVAVGGANQSMWRRQAHVAEIGMGVRRPFWNLGIGRAIGRYLIDWGRAVGLRKLILRVFDDNDRGIALYRSLGFEEEGRLRQDVLRADGRYSDTLVMGLFLDKGAPA
jgi:RimJ/RimL family protein N-acetyltransferase